MAKGTQAIMAIGVDEAPTAEVRFVQLFWPATALLARCWGLLDSGSSRMRSMLVVICHHCHAGASV